MEQEKRVNLILDKIKMGWNLGNFLDAHDKKFKIGNVQSKSIEYVVNLWGNPIFNFECLEALKKVNINCLRIPITWCNFIDIKDNNISISPSAFSYIREIVDIALKNDFVVIIDMHHDDQTWLKVACSKKEFKGICRLYKKIWSLISYNFRDYDENLVFEGMNEIVDRTNPDHHDWIGNDKIFFKRLSVLYKIFIKTARRYSLKNKQRTLMISTYGAQIHETALKNFIMPKDDNLIVDMHFYSKHTDLEYYQKKFRFVEEYFINKNIPIILGEIGTKKGFENDFEILKIYKSYVDKLNIKCVLWDNGSSRSFINRENCNTTIDFSIFK